MGAGNSATAKIAVAVSIPVAVVLLVLLTIAYLCKRRNKKPHKHVQISSAGECFTIDPCSKSTKKINSQAQGLLSILDVNVHNHMLFFE